MKLNQWIRMALIGSLIVLLTGCHSMRKYHNQSAVNDANSAYANLPQGGEKEGAKSSGIGEEAGLAEQTQGRNLTKRLYHFAYDSSIVQAADKPGIVANANYLVTHSKAR